MWPQFLGKYRMALLEGDYLPPKIQEFEILLEHASIQSHTSSNLKLQFDFLPGFLL